MSRQEVEQIRQWIDDYLEDRLELSDEVKAKLDQSRAEIAAVHADPELKKERQDEAQPAGPGGSSSPGRCSR